MATVERSETQPVAMTDLTVLARRRFDVDEYHKMGETGVIGPDEHVELIHGDVFVMSPAGNRHAGCVTLLTKMIVLALAGRGLVSPLNPLRIDRHTEPEPDLTNVMPRRDGYTRAHPTPADVLFAVKVMETSASFDRHVKLRLYARSRVPELWLVDLNKDQVEVYWRPEGEGYAQSHTAARGGSVAPEAFPDAMVGVDDLLGLGGPR